MEWGQNPEHSAAGQKTRNMPREENYDSKKIEHRTLIDSAAIEFTYGILRNQVFAWATEDPRDAERWNTAFKKALQKRVNTNEILIATKRTPAFDMNCSF